MILDSNSLLHFQRPDQIDWPAMLGCRSVNLVITPTLVRELEEEKVKNRSRRLRDRAQAIVQWIANYIEINAPVEIRSGVRLIIVRHSPLLNFAEHKLSHAVSDDEFIAHAIEFERERGCHVTFFTADIGLRLKLPAHGFKALVPPDDLKLPDEPDETEKENAKLKAELSRHTNRLPRLKLSFLDGSTKFSLPSQRLAVDEIEAGAPHGWGTSQGAYDKYLRDFEKWKVAARSSTAFGIRLANNGSAVATNISLELSFPDFVLAKELGPEPKVPNSLGLSHLHSFEVPSDDAPSYGERHDTISFDITNLVHNRVFESDLVWLRFKGDELIKNFSVDYQITCVEIVDPIRGYLHFTVEEWTALIEGESAPG